MVVVDSLQAVDRIAPACGPVDPAVEYRPRTASASACAWPRMHAPAPQRADAGFRPEGVVRADAPGRSLSTASNRPAPTRPAIAFLARPPRGGLSVWRQADRPDAARRGRIASAPGGPGARRTVRFLDRRRYEVLALRRSWLGMLLRRSSSSARSAMRSSSVISRHTVERRDPDLRTWPAASSLRSSLRVGL